MMPTQALDAHPRGHGQRRHSSLVLLSKRLCGRGEVRASQPEQLDDRGREAQAQADESHDAEACREQDVVDEAHAVMPVFGDASRRPDDPAQENVGEAPHGPTLIQRRHRRHHVLRRTQRVVLMPVLDVGDAPDVIKPGSEVDPRGHVPGIAGRIAGATRASR
jgi:hypothetical protein